MESAHPDLKAPDRDFDLEFAVHGVKMRRAMILEVHTDDDSKEPRNLRRRATVNTSACLRLTCPSTPWLPGACPTLSAHSKTLVLRDADSARSSAPDELADALV